MRTRHFRDRISQAYRLRDFSPEEIKAEGIVAMSDGRILRTICGEGHRFDPEHNQSCPECENLAYARLKAAREAAGCAKTPPSTEA